LTGDLDIRPEPRLSGWVPWGTCRILPSYIGRYALADSLEDKAHAGVGRIPATEFSGRPRISAGASTSA
jgi:hypothetical protein